MCHNAYINPEIFYTAFFDAGDFDYDLNARREPIYPVNAKTDNGVD